MGNSVPDSESKAQELVGILSYLRAGDGLKGYLAQARAIAETLDTATLQAALKEAIIARTKYGIRESYLDAVLIMIRDFEDLLGDTLQSPDVQEVATDAIYDYLEKGWIKSVVPLIQAFKVPAHALEQDQGIQKYAKKALSACLDTPREELIALAQALRVPEDFLTSEAFNRGRRDSMNLSMERKNAISMGRMPRR